MPIPPGLTILSVLVLALEAPARDTPARPVDFNREIRPILSNRCYACHGPDAGKRKGVARPLRLDTEEGAFADLGGYSAIIRGNPEESELIRRVASDDPIEVMPPPKHAARLPAAEVERLSAWVKQGAPYARHWAYRKPSRPALPEVRDAAWAANPVDRFLLARMEKEGLAPSPQADRNALVRRLSLDLTGLPPTPEEVDGFARDDRPDAYERLVDRLLEKPAYGEHWARIWLDLARYADSAGYADDPARVIWAYRDYVIRSFNANKPFDRMTIEQIAGDLLPGATDDQLIATAFHRNTMTNSEGGTNDEEFRNAAIVDRVNTTMAVWMGTTIACAQCHDHKYDPLPQADFFRLFAFFNNTEDADRNDESPRLPIESEDLKRRKAAAQSEIGRLESTLRTPTPEASAGQPHWEKSFEADLTWHAPKPTSATSREGAAVSILDDSSVRIGPKAKTDVATVTLPIEGGRLSALRLEALPDDSLPEKGPGHSGGSFIVTKVRASVLPPVESRPIPFVDAFADEPGAADVLPDGKGDGWAVGGPPGRPHILTLVAASPIPVEPGSTLTVVVEQQSKKPGQTLGRFRLSTSADDRAGEFARTPPPVLAILKTPADLRSESQRAELARHYLADVAPELKPARDRLAALKKQLSEMKPETTVPVLRELPANARRKTQIQRRGNFMDLAEEVTEGVPEAIQPLPAGAGRDRLALARWLVADDNPLTARVIANRYWETIFGAGLVPTSEEFGSQGEPPTHPELLDWLATELVAQRWDLKRFLRLLVTSAAYRQSSKVTPEGLRLDPANQWLARGPRFRLPAETVRDQALAIAGLLSPKMFGPPVRPPQPSTGLNAAFGAKIDWQTSMGDDKYRRGLYTTWRRSNPYPSMATFDAPNREVCIVKRTRTNTPLQALVTLNDPVYVEAAQALARRIAAVAGDRAEKVRLGFRLCLARDPSDREIARLGELFDEAHARYARDPEAARKMATEPLGPAPGGSDPADLAAWTVVGNVLLNLDETLMRR